MKCCGIERETKFCADCGMALEQQPIYTLLSHIVSQARKSKRKSDKIKVSDPKWITHPSHRAAAKWEAWEEALRELLDPRL